MSRSGICEVLDFLAELPELHVSTCLRVADSEKISRINTRSSLGLNEGRREVRMLSPWTIDRSSQLTSLTLLGALSLHMEEVIDLGQWLDTTPLENIIEQLLVGEEHLLFMTAILRVEHGLHLRGMVGSLHEKISTILNLVGCGGVERDRERCLYSLRCMHECGPSRERLMTAQLKLLLEQRPSSPIVDVPFFASIIEMMGPRLFPALLVSIEFSEQQPDVCGGLWNIAHPLLLGLTTSQRSAGHVEAEADRVRARVKSCIAVATRLCCSALSSSVSDDLSQLVGGIRLVRSINGQSYDESEIDSDDHLHAIYRDWTRACFCPTSSVNGPHVTSSRGSILSWAEMLSARGEDSLESGAIAFSLRTRQSVQKLFDALSLLVPETQPSMLRVEVSAMRTHLGSFPELVRDFRDLAKSRISEIDAPATVAPRLRLGASALRVDDATERAAADSFVLEVHEAKGRTLPTRLLDLAENPASRDEWRRVKEHLLRAPPSVHDASSEPLLESRVRLITSLAQRELVSRDDFLRLKRDAAKIIDAARQGSGENRSRQLVSRISLLPKLLFGSNEQLVSELDKLREALRSFEVSSATPTDASICEQLLSSWHQCTCDGSMLQHRTPWQATFVELVCCSPRLRRMLTDRVTELTASERAASDGPQVTTHSRFLYVRLTQQPSNRC